MVRERGGESSPSAGWQSVYRAMAVSPDVDASWEPMEGDE